MFRAAKYRVLFTSVAGTLLLTILLQHCEVQTCWGSCYSHKVLILITVRSITDGKTDRYSS